MARAPYRYLATFVALCVFALSAAARATDVSTSTVLRVGTSGDYMPFSFHDPTGALAGFDVAVAQRLAADLGRRVEFVPFRWADLVDKLRRGAFEIAMSGVTARADRAVHLRFTRPYAISGAVAVIRLGDATKFRTILDLDRAGVRVAVNRGGHLERVAQQRFAHARLLPVANNVALPGLLQGGVADAILSEEFEARTWPSGQFKVIGPFTRDRKAYALPGGATDLLRQVNDWLAAREADGWLNAQRRRWLGERAMWTEQQADFEALVGAMDLRLQLMPLVAAVKRREHLPIEDAAQEARVLEHVRSAAEVAGLNADDVARLFQLQMEAAKAVERRAAPESGQSGASLTDLRAAVAAVSDQVLSELVRCQRWLADPHQREALDGTTRDALRRDGVPTETVTKLLEALHRVRRNQP